MYRFKHKPAASISARLLSVTRHITFVILPLTFLAAGCGNRAQPTAGEGNSSGNHAENGQSPKPGRISGTRVITPSDRQHFVIGEAIPMKLERISDSLPGIDSIEFYLSGNRIHACLEEPWEFTITGEMDRVGTVALRMIGHYEDGRKEYHDLDVILLSDIKPRTLDFKILNSWPHDRGAYTQGLVWEDGFLYEGTGQWNESSLRKTDIRSGEAVHIMNLPDDVFGEGITILNDRIFQLTYKSQVGFVYDKESFRRIQKVYYENKEGWGLTHNGENLIMSDGSHRIYYMDPEYFSEIRQIEVYDDKGPVNRLNELEYIEGKIFANIYGEEEIVVIDPESGKVSGRINMQGILPQEDRHRRIDVFNGIAWNPDQRILYVTGKYWPRLFEVSLQDEF
jgi:glutamine cyclotransferase